ncbi:MAG: hypothetical protein A2161_17525 [Candidatus Schekmanbacteria bacterium RBG_13_48_7]|uniref:Uncharacterized protein n=1 Tax=Candidatus Schekmanbacteria bacterium RBG_13_48_7 TaxID=1817878 RepID=A0A1F7S0K1_9BACT|nr:MAG: hypothetical protein A2161_17525 [Candidatus Schekmanbacteria bacterium RBG_13_48_7]
MAVTVIWRASSTEVFAGGHGTFIRYDGVTWMALGSGHPYVNYYYDRIWGTSSTDVYYVGGESSLHVGIVLHYDGASWSESLRTDYPFLGMWGTSSTDIYTVGDNGQMFHYDGSTWNYMDSKTRWTLNAICGIPSGEMNAVGGDCTGINDCFSRYLAIPDTTVAGLYIILSIVSLCILVFLKIGYKS